MRPIIDAGQHDQRRHCRHLEGERQQHRDRRNRPDPRQHTHKGAEKRADETIEEIDWREGDIEAQPEMIEDFHVAPPRRQ
jgi:hypothetical protein